MPVYAREARSIDPSNRGFARHVVRWAHPEYKVNGERIELVGTNSHNTAARFKFMAGVFRLVCSNGLVVRTSDFGSFGIKHIGDIVVQVREAVGQIAGMAGQIAGKMKEYKAIEMTPDEQGVFASTAHQFLYNKEPEKAPVSAERLLVPRRREDAQPDTGWDYYSARYGQGYAKGLPKADLWTTFNVVQENITKGGIRYYRSSGKKRRGKTRQIQSIEKDIKLNQALWSMTEQMAELKRAA